MLNEHIENEDYYIQYYKYKNADMMKGLLSMLALFVTVGNFEYDLTINHTDYLYEEVTSDEKDQFLWR